MNLTELMTSEVLATTADTSVAAAAAAMTERGIGSAVVLDGDDLVGICTERDVLRAAASGNDLTAQTVSDWMTADPITIAVDELPSQVAALMMEHGFRHLPVTEDGRLVGILSMRDVWRFSFLPSEPDDLTLRA